MATIGTLAVNIVARTDKFVRGIAKSRSVSTKMVASLAAVGTAGTALGASMIRTSETIERAMTKSLAIMGDVSEKMRGDMVQAANKVARETEASTAQAAESYFFLASAGLSAEQALQAMPIVAKFAQAGNFDLATATDLVTDAQSALGLSSKDTAKAMKEMARVSDVLVKANTLANASVEQFSKALVTGAGAALKLVNKDVEEGVAVLAAYADQGIKGEQAGTALSIVMRDLQTKAIKEAEAFDKAGVAVFDQTGKMQNLASIVGDLERLLAGLSDEQSKFTLLSLGFSDKSVGYLQSLLGMSEKIKEYEKNLRMAGGTTQEVADKSMTDLQKATQALSAAWDQLSLSLGNSLEKMGLFKAAAEAAEGTAIILDRIQNKEQESRELKAAKKAGGVLQKLNPLYWLYKGSQAGTDAAMRKFDLMPNSAGPAQPGFADQQMLQSQMRAEMQRANFFGGSSKKQEDEKANRTREQQLQVLRDIANKVGKGGKSVPVYSASGM